MEFDETLDTVGPIEWNDTEEGVMSTAHPLKLEDGRSLNLLTVIGSQCQYILYTTPNEKVTNVKRTRVATIDTQMASYMHSFGVTRNWSAEDSRRLRFFSSSRTCTCVLESHTGSSFLIVPKKGS